MTSREKKIFQTGEYSLHILSTNPLERNDSSRIPKEKVLEIMTLYFNTTMDRVRVFDRDKNMVKIRMFICLYLKTYTHLTLSHIGKTINRDHTSVLHMMKRWQGEKLYKDTQKTKDEIDSIFKSCGLI
jgi:chromosomal replication initiation ATPase DnaA